MPRTPHLATATDTATATPTPDEIGTITQVAEPVFNPPGGSFDTNDPVTVTITTTTPGANIRYTLDSSTPTMTHGTLISASSGTASVTPAMFTHPTQLQAVAFKAVGQRIGIGKIGDREDRG